MSLMIAILGCLNNGVQMESSILDCSFLLIGVRVVLDVTKQMNDLAEESDEEQQVDLV